MWLHRYSHNFVHIRNLRARLAIPYLFDITRPFLGGTQPYGRNMSSPVKSDSEGQASHGRPGRVASTAAQGEKGSRGPLTHFLALPLHGMHYTTLPASHAAFKTAIRQFAIDETDPEASLSETAIIPKDAIRDFNTLHLTLGVMSLSSERLKDAIALLESLDLKQILSEVSSTSTNKGEKLFVELKGVKSMSRKASDIKRTSVLYIPPSDAGDRLYPFARAVRDRFIQEGIMEAESRPLLLHATIVNTIYAKKPKKKDGKGRNDRNARITFDATELLEKYDGHVFAESIEIERVQICEMGAKKGQEVVLEDGSVDIVGGGYTAVASQLV